MKILKSFVNLTCRLQESSEQKLPKQIFEKNVHLQNGFSKNQFVALAWPVAVQNIFKRCMGLGPSLAPTAAFGVWALAAGAFES